MGSGKDVMSLGRFPPVTRISWHLPGYQPSHYVVVNHELVANHHAKNHPNQYARQNDKIEINVGFMGFSSQPVSSELQD
jgi:hypothetical protein